MKKLALLSIIAVLISEPAAACHRFSYWAFNTPQKCGGVYARQRAPPPPHLTDDEDHSWYVEITKLPPGWSLDPERADAIERLKPLMEGQPQ
jgi:hypothetical protein